ncbi:MAG TPA: NYN domain-containing protein [Acidimicrobiales bacterium]|nr:NYN domain-containing protein [Acidimicrobiales bacterium]
MGLTLSPEDEGGAGPAGDAADGLLRRALQLAVDVARVGYRSTPPVEPPRAVRKLVTFVGRLPDAALPLVRRALDEDAEFRGRVAELADEEELGRAGWLFVTRPEGWEHELALVTEDAERRALAEREEREERSARKRLAHAEAATNRAEEAAAKARGELAAATAELAAERRQRRDIQEEAARLGRRVTSLEGERDSARRRADAAAADAERLGSELDAARRDLEEARAAAAALRAEAEAAALRARADQLRKEPAAPAAPPVAGPPPAGLAAVARAVAAASEAAAALGRALEEAAAGLAPSPPPQAPPAARPPARPRRRPASLPPAVFDDSTEAAAHLVRVPRAEVLVDGYNAAMALWPDHPPAELRERLVDAVAELVARTGASVHVVFDGADLGGPPARPATMRGVRVSFSPPDVEADDEILRLVDELPADRPVVVASSDRRVQDGARRRGANVIDSYQLAAVLGRS